MPGVLTVDGGLSLSGRCNHASPREIIASRGSLLGTPGPRMEAGSPCHSARHNTDDTAGGVPWLCSCPSADQTKTDCLDEAPSAEAIREAARRANGSAAVIVEARGDSILLGSHVPPGDGLDFSPNAATRPG